ncbi:unnamed protein product (macronuclear) [Paramecium tetraurelia]|uniref:Protein kinase domain-containing protein n=1 Tax=Paramecium tetraurelia TaxID=5888 RepID=A0BHZ5_PARTE|nr:uncharacterized protein GSPATT00029198001 [Paramecium tetraurelia]CAK58162.1 unnamed protein product [Paramecium tetraurelia]|eukprot:XP_001425560.1 hypothetical protein (macronuclear) [Paramecium tetraurelia strain d4-2]
MNRFIMKKRDYQFLQIIGSGSFAKVYLAENSQNQQFAIKVITIEFDGSESSQKQLQYFEQEIQIYKNIKNDNGNENVVALIEEFREDEKIYCVFEFCKNGDLNNLLKNNNLKEEEIKPIFIEILKGMKYIYQKGIVHRDLKIDNILIDENQVVKIADFGFAKYYNQNDVLTSYCGTPATMAPEVLNQEEYDYKCDIWSLGVILYYMIYRKYHFSSKVRSLIDLIKELQNFKINFDDKVIQLSDFGKDLLSKMLDSNKKTRIDYEQLFSHPWLQGALLDNVRNSKIVINKLFVNQENKLLGGIVRKFRLLKADFLAILGKIQQLCKDEAVKSLFGNLYKLIDEEKQHIQYLSQSALVKQQDSIIDYKVETYKTLEEVYKIIQYDHLDIVTIESELINFLKNNHLSNYMTITLKGQYTQEELDKIQQSIVEVDLELDFQELKHLLRLETNQIDSQLECRVQLWNQGRELKLMGQQIQQSHQKKLEGPSIELSF